AFEESAEAEFVRDLALTVREQQGEQVADLSDDDLEDAVALGIERARLRGLTGQQAIAIFVGLMFQFAPNFDEQQNIRDVLSDERLPPDLRLELVVEHASDRDWTEAEQLYDETAWEWDSLERLQLSRD